MQGLVSWLVGVNPLPWAWHFTKTLLPAQRGLIVFAYSCLLICRLNANTTEWINTQISRNIANGPKSNNCVLVGIWITICIQKPSHHFLQTFHHLRMFKIVFRDSSLYSKQMCLSCVLWLISANFAKTLVWKAWIWRQIMMSQTTHTKCNDTIRLWMKPPLEHFLRTPLYDSHMDVHRICDLTVFTSSCAFLT